jgi:4-hydroxy-3-methylbut-2-enyl diphosphate reductase
LIELLKQRCEDVGNIDFIAHNTICNRVSNRAKELVDFANSVDIVVFVSGTNSSNGKYLYDYCKKVKSNTLFVSTESELTVDMFDGIKRIGITGATSTPMWLMKKVEAWLQKNL